MIFGILENSRIGICTVIIFYPTIFVEKIQNILSKNVFGRKYFWIEKNTGEKNVDRIKTTFFLSTFFLDHTICDPTIFATKLFWNVFNQQLPDQKLLVTYSDLKFPKIPKIILRIACDNLRNIAKRTNEK